MRQSRIVRSRRTLDRFLKASMEALPGALMGHYGVKDDGEGADLIAYLAQASAIPDLRPSELVSKV